MRAALALGLFAALTLAQANARPMKPGFVDAAERVPGLVTDIRYAGSDNFVGRPIAGYEAPRCLLTPQAADALRAAQALLERDGYGLKVFDCYRPARAVADFVAWARDLSDQRMKARYYPDVDKADLFRLGYIAARSAHSRGSTVDLTLVRRADGGEVDMGTPFDLFGPLSTPDSRRISAPARANRDRLRAAMIRAGFKGLREEWWHFTLAREPHPAAVFDLPVR